MPAEASAAEDEDKPEDKAEDKLAETEAIPTGDDESHPEEAAAAAEDDVEKSEGTPGSDKEELTEAKGEQATSPTP